MQLAMRIETAQTHDVLNSFSPDITHKVLIDDAIVGFYVVSDFPDHLHLDHLYVHPDHQSKRIGSEIMLTVIERSRVLNKPIMLGALKGSRSNRFYLSHGFKKIDDSEFDNFYEFTHNS